MKDGKPVVSIIMATYNRAHFLPETLNYICNQSFLNWECIIIDDGSADKTASVVEKFISRDSRIKYQLRSPDYRKGLPGCRNQGMDLARGEFIVFFDDDDIPHPQLLEFSIMELQESDYDFCRYLRSTFNGVFTPKFEIFKTYSTLIIGKKDLELVILNDIPFNSCQVVWRKSSIGLNRFIETLMYAEEWEFYTRLLAMGLKGISINKEMYFGRKHPNSNTAEFYRKEPLRIKSQIDAALLVINNLNSKKLFNNKIKVYFIRMGFELNSHIIIRKSLEAFGSNPIEKLKYHMGYHFYPVLKPIFNLKAKFLKF